MGVLHECDKADHRKKIQSQTEEVNASLECENVQVEKGSVVVTGKVSDNIDVKRARPSRICSFDFEEGKVNNIVEHFKAGTENNFHVQRIFTPAKKRGFDFELLRSSLEYQTKPGNESVVAASPAKRRRLYS